jgi:hypothetical protein
MQIKILQNITKYYKILQNITKYYKILQILQIIQKYIPHYIIFL